MAPPAGAQVDLSRADIVTLKTSTEAVHEAESPRTSRMFSPVVPGASAEAMRKARPDPVKNGPALASEAGPWRPRAFTPEELGERAVLFARTLAIEAGFSDPKGAALEREAKAVQVLLDQVRARYPDFPIPNPSGSSLSCSVVPKPFSEGEKRVDALLPPETPVRKRFRRCLISVAQDVGADPKLDYAFGGFHFKMGFRDGEKVAALFKACPDVQDVSCGPDGSPGWPVDYLDMKRTGKDEYALTFHRCVGCGDLGSDWRTRTIKVVYQPAVGRFSFGAPSAETEKGAVPSR